MMGPRTVTADGFEKTFQVNHLAGFLLTSLLLPKLIASSAKVIQTASQAAKDFGDFDIDDLQNANSYGPLTAYGNGKLANILFTRELHHRYAEQGIAAVAFHPGVVGSSFASDTTHVMRFLYHTPVAKNLFTISPEKGAGQLVWLAGGTPGTDWQPGSYYEKKQPERSLPEAHDGELATRLWDESAPDGAGSRLTPKPTTSTPRPALPPSSRQDPGTGYTPRHHPGHLRFHVADRCGPDVGVASGTTSLLEMLEGDRCA